MKTGKLDAIAVSSAKRSSSLPDVPTLIESGVAGFEVNSRVGILAPAQTSRPVVDKLDRELNAVLASPEIVEKLATLGIAAMPETPVAFAAQIQADLAKYGKVVKEAGIKAGQARLQERLLHGRRSRHQVVQQALELG